MSAVTTVRSQLGKIRRNPTLRGVAVNAGILAPRSLHAAAEGEVIRKYAAGRKSLLEIGVYEGASAVEIIEEASTGAKIDLIDPFFAQEAGYEAAGGAKMAQVTSRTVNRAAARRGDVELNIHVTISAEAAKSWSRPLDFLMIDGDHTYEGVCIDWNEFSPHVQIGGVVLLHDARSIDSDGNDVPKGTYPINGPEQLVDEQLRGSDQRWKIVEERHSLVVVERVSY